MGYTLSDICNELMIEMGENQPNRFARYYQLGTACLREQNMDLTGVPVVTELKLNANDTVNLPANYLNYTRIALCGKDGALHSLGRNDNLCLDKTYDDCGNVPDRNSATMSGASQATTIAGIWWSSDYLDDNVRNGELMGRFFGIGGGNNANGYYRFDLNNGQILLGRLPKGTDKIVLEYLADIDSQDGDFTVHPFLVETVKNWIFWKLIARDRSRNANEKQMAMIDFQKSERISRIRFNSRTADEWLAAFRAGNQAAVKW
jgi:hypothetical protein